MNLLQWWNNVKLVLLIVSIFMMCLFPLWPTVLRSIVWYVAVTLLIVLLSLSIVQVSQGLQSSKSPTIAPSMRGDPPISTATLHAP